MNEEKIIEDFNNLKKNKDIIKEHNITREQLRVIMNKRYSNEELAAFKLERTRQREKMRTEKYYFMYHNDEKYHKIKKDKARIRYWVKKTLDTYK